MNRNRSKPINKLNLTVIFFKKSDRLKIFFAFVTKKSYKNVRTTFAVRHVCHELW